jgi:hypothetical protein
MSSSAGLLVEPGRRASGGFCEGIEMLQRGCDICGEPATIHETTIRAGEAVTRRLCREHGDSLLPKTIPGIPAASLPTTEELYRNLSEAEREHLSLLYRLSKRTL